MFLIGLHNIWLKLWVHIATSLLIVTMSVLAVRHNSLAIGTISLLGTLNALLSHTMPVEPLSFVLLAAALRAAESAAKLNLSAIQIARQL